MFEQEKMLGVVEKLLKIQLYEGGETPAWVVCAEFKGEVITIRALETGVVGASVTIGVQDTEASFARLHQFMRFLGPGWAADPALDLARRLSALASSYRAWASSSGHSLYVVTTFPRPMERPPATNGGY